MSEQPKRVVIVGGGFAGLNAAKSLGRDRRFEVVLIDRRNHHLFQPLLYQVAMAGLSPAEIAAPIRNLVRGANVRVVKGEVKTVDYAARRVSGDFGEQDYDYLLIAAGAKHAYFGNEAWEPHAPGLKTLEQATEIRRRVLEAFEMAEREADPERRRQLLTFVIVGGGPTGVELAGAIGEMSRFTLGRDFRNADPKLTRVILVEGGPRILAAFSDRLAARATRDLEGLGVQVWTNSLVTHVGAHGVEVGEERIRAKTVLWAAGVKASSLSDVLGTKQDRAGRVMVGPDLSIEGHPEVFVAGDQAHTKGNDGRPLPGVAPVAVQQGRWIAAALRRELDGKPRGEFEYFDKGQMATIGRSRAVLQSGRMQFGGLFAWLAWLFVHVYYLSGFRNRVFVLLQWAWSYLTFSRGARLIVGKDWRSYPDAGNKGEGQDPDEDLPTARTG